MLNSRKTMIPALVCFLLALTGATVMLGQRATARPIGPGPDAIYDCNQALAKIEAQNPPGLTIEQYNAAAVKIDEAIAILEDRKGAAN